jgi:glycosyltransferase involved in cell wall biosynthesis
MSSRKRALLVTYGPWRDPPQRQAIMSLAAAGYKCAVFLIETRRQEEVAVPEGVEHIFWHPPRLLSKLPRPARSLFKFLSFRRQVRISLRQYRPELLIGYMYHALAAVAGSKKQLAGMFILGGIVDVFSMCDAGLLDRWIIPAGTRALRQADAVWCSDAFKAELTTRAAGLQRNPIVCHNCPTLDYLPEPQAERDGWLRAQLRKVGAMLGETGGSILLRAGAVSECGGIEETLAVMHELPADYVFLLMGRPPEPYKRQLLARITALGLGRRAFLWDRPSDQVWKNALHGADIGHLIHGPFPPGRMSRLYELNSSLSNNRLFQYMAAGLPIIAYDDPRMSGIYAEVPCFRVARLSCLKQDILQAWKGLGGNHELREQLGSTARLAHLKKYNWEVQFAPVLDTVNASTKEAQTVASRVASAF